MLRSAEELMHHAVAEYVKDNVPAMEVLIASYEERRKDGGFEPTVYVRGDTLKDLLIDLINTKEELAAAQSKVKKLPRKRS